MAQGVGWVLKLLCTVALQIARLLCLAVVVKRAQPLEIYLCDCHCHQDTTHHTLFYVTDTPSLMLR